MFFFVLGTLPVGKETVQPSDLGFLKETQTMKCVCSGRLNRKRQAVGLHLEEMRLDLGEDERWGGSHCGDNSLPEGAAWAKVLGWYLAVEGELAEEEEETWVLNEASMTPSVLWLCWGGVGPCPECALRDRGRGAGGAQ